MDILSRDPTTSVTPSSPGRGMFMDAGELQLMPRVPADITGLLLDAICIVDSSGRFMAIRGACEGIFGYRPEEMIGKPMIDFVYHEDRARTLQAANRVMSGYLQRHFENRYVRKDGRLVRISWSAQWSPENGVRIAVARDVTDRSISAAMAETLDQACSASVWRLSGAPPRLIPPGLSAVPLSAQDHLVLLALASGDGCVSRRAIVEALGEDYRIYDRRRLDTQMRRLRRKVEEACGLALPVATVRGTGFRIYQRIEICP